MFISFLQLVLTRKHNPNFSPLFKPAALLNKLLLNRTCSTQSSAHNFPKSDLYYGITLLRSPKASVLPILENWANEGNKLGKSEIVNIIRTLRSRKRHAQALEISEWMNNQRYFPFLEVNQAIHLDLLGKVHGVGAAESYFRSQKVVSENFYCALLNCYVQERLVDKALSLFHTMKELSIARGPLTYNGIMCLYKNTKQNEKIPDVLADMRNNNAVPDNVSYRMCMQSYMTWSDSEGREKILSSVEKDKLQSDMEKLLREMESDPRVSVDWKTYSNVAGFYVKLGIREKARHYLKKAEQRLAKSPSGFNHLITVHASLGNKFEMLRLWAKQKASCQRQVNGDYITMLGSLVKINDIEAAERIFKEWEQSGNLYDFQVPNALLLGYTKSRMTEKAENMLHDLINKGITPNPNSWSILAAGYYAEKNMEKAVECMKKSFVQSSQFPNWTPRPTLISRLLYWLGKERDIEEVEAFVKSLNNILPMDRKMYHALIRANIRHGREVDHVLRNMKADNIKEDEETVKILARESELKEDDSCDDLMV